MHMTIKGNLTYDLNQMVLVSCCFLLVFSGIILVHDLTNKKSSQNLYRWSLEALNKDSSPTGVIVSNG